MNIQEYIETGILEAYTLGDLSEQEQAEVEMYLQQYAGLRDELAKIELSVEKMVFQTALKPRAEVKVKLFEKIKKEKIAKVVPLVSTSPTGWSYAAAASIAIALFSSFLAYNYRSKWKTSESALTELIAQNLQMAEDYNQVNLRLDKIETDLKVTGSPNFTRVLMKGTPNAPESLASIYWNERTKEIFLSLESMKELAKENQYQLWAIVDGKPVDCGVFDAGVEGLLKMKGVLAVPTTFAVTIEPRGGNTSPSIETMQVAGNLVKG